MQGIFSFCLLLTHFVDIFISTCRMTIIFLSTYSLMLGEYFWYLQRVLKVIFDDSGALWSEKIGKNCRKVRNFYIVQNRFWSIFCAVFSISFDIFISTCRMTLIFLLTYSLMLVEYFWYLQRLLKVIFDACVALWSEKFGKKKWRKVRGF